MSKFEYLLNRMAIRYGVHTIFSDFLDLLICGFAHGKREKEYLDTINKYEKPEAYSLSEALGALVIEMARSGEGFVDVLGKYYEDNVSHGNNGQYFTPVHICKLLAELQYTDSVNPKIMDPACGSGRMLLAAGKMNPTATFFGADNDVTCAKMTVLNLCLNRLYGEVAIRLDAFF